MHIFEYQSYFPYKKIVFYIYEFTPLNPKTKSIDYKRITTTCTILILQIYRYTQQQITKQTNKHNIFLYYIYIDCLFALPYIYTYYKYIFYAENIP